VQTVGFFHKAVKAVTFEHIWIEHFLFYLLFCLSLCLVFWLAAITILSQREGDKRSLHLLFGAVMAISFFAVISFSLDVWEKYLVPFLPFLLGWILTCAKPKTSLPLTDSTLIPK
jgi:hypothetical protein